MSQKKPRSAAHTILRALGVTLFAAVVIVGWVFHREIRDTFLAWQYEPTSDIREIVSRTTLTSSGERIFYASQPELLDQDAFNQSCASSHESFAVLGCYRDERIYVYQIDDAELDGAKEATAAHELLHAVWVRLSTSKRHTLETELEAAFQRIKTPELEDRMSYYEDQDPTVRVNELHSILGTEYDNLGPALEDHYARYFSDRSKVVALHASYNDRFTELERAAVEIERQLASQKQVIDATQAAYEAALTRYVSEVDQHNQALQVVDRTSETAVNQYNARSDELRAREGVLEQQRVQLERYIEQYNQLVAEHNAVALRQSTLYERLDSRVDTAPSL